MSLTYHPVWTNNLSCQGPPSSIYRFDISETSLLVPISFTFTYNGYPYMFDLCGYSPLPTFSVGCCWTSWDTSQTTYSSYMISAPNDNSESQFEYWMPKDTNGKGYCYFALQGSVGLIERWVLDDGSCQDNYVSCQSGVLSIWNVSSGCGSGVATTYGPAFYGTTQILFGGNITIDYKTVAGASQVVSWIGVMPGENLYITYNTSLRIFGGVLVGLGSLLSVLGLVWYIFKVIQLQTILSVGCVLSQSLLTVAMVSLTTMNSLVITDNTIFFNTLETMSVTRALGTLSLLFVNAHALIQLNHSFMFFNRTWKKALVYFIIVTVHVLLTWQSYCKIGYMAPWISNWDTITTPIWFLVCLICNNLCVAGLVYTLAKSAITLANTSSQITMSRIMAYLFYEARFSFFLLIMCVLNTIFYITVSVLTNYSNALGNDVDLYGAVDVGFVAFPINSILTIGILEVEKARKQRTTGKKSQGTSVSTSKPTTSTAVNL